MPRKSTATDKPLKEHILDVASKLFYERGIHAVGIDRVIAEAKIAKTSLYRYFPSKDELIKAYLEHRNQLFWKALETSIAKEKADPEQQMRAIIDWIIDLIRQPTCTGCPFLLTASEFPDPEHPAYQSITAHKYQLRDRLSTLAQAAQFNNPDALANQLIMVIDGGFAGMRYLKAENICMALNNATEAIIKAAKALN